MSENRNDIIEEQRKAREEFIKLKKMQQGEIEPEAKPSEIAIKPKTFREKWHNYWYHYKVQTLIAMALIAVVVIGVTQCAARKKYDYEILYFAYTPALDPQTEAIGKYFEKYGEDVNGDGKVNVKMVNCSVADTSKDASREDVLFRVQSILAAEKEIVVYVVDDKAIEYFENALDYSLFTEPPFALSEDFYKETNISDEVALPQGLSVGLRILEGTGFEGDEKAETAFKEGKKLVEKIKKQSD